MKKGIEAKLALAEAFVELVEQMPLERVTINMIVDCVGKHRKTFYYHFSSKDDLIVWLFRYELACELEKVFTPEQLVYEPEGGHYTDFAYYARNLAAGLRIYNAPFFDALYACFGRRRKYYQRVFAILGQGTFESYLIRLYQPALEDDIRYLLDRKLLEQNMMEREGIREKVCSRYSISFLSEFFTCAFISRYVQRLNYAPDDQLFDDIAPFENVIHDSIGWIIHQEVTGSWYSPIEEE